MAKALNLQLLAWPYAPRPTPNICKHALTTFVLTATAHVWHLTASARHSAMVTTFCTHPCSQMVMAYVVRQHADALASAEAATEDEEEEDEGVQVRARVVRRRTCMGSDRVREEWMGCQRRDMMPMANPCSSGCKGWNAGVFFHDVIVTGADCKDSHRTEKCAQM